MPTSTFSSLNALAFYDGHNARRFDAATIDSAPKAEIVGDWSKHSWEAGWREAEHELQARIASRNHQLPHNLSNNPT